MINKQIPACLFGCCHRRSQQRAAPRTQPPPGWAGVWVCGCVSVWVCVWVGGCVCVGGVSGWASVGLRRVRASVRENIVIGGRPKKTSKMKGFAGAASPFFDLPTYFEPEKFSY